MTQVSGVANIKANELPIRGQSSAIKDVCDRAQQIAATDRTVLIIGETGTGKGLIAQKVYHQSNRKDKPLIRINCATPPDTPLKCDLLGISKEDYQASTSAAINNLRGLAGATLLIDEISELSTESQAHLLEVLEWIENENSFSGKDKIDIRLIITSQHDLKNLAEMGRFNKRLYYHISLFTLSIPPLRKRGEDKQRIAEHLLEETCAKYNLSNKTFSKDAIQAINDHSWPGNYRELRNTVERAALLTQGNEITTRDLELDIIAGLKENDEERYPQKLAESDTTNVEQGLSLEDYFQHFVLENQENMTETELAQKLGISRKCLWERRQRYSIPRRKNGAK